MRHLPAFYFDLALGMVFAMIAIIAVSTVKPPKKDDTPPVTPKAEFLITLSWNDSSIDDLDLYARGPDGQIVFFKSKSAPYMFLDHDDTGRGDTVAMPDGSSQTVPTRIEVITIRAIVPGDYAVNTHCYAKGSDTGYVDHAKLRIVKLNPFSVVTETEADFDAAGEEKTLANFTVASDGSVSSVYLSPTKMVGQP